MIGIPVQFMLVKFMFGQRKKGVKITDQRIRITTEVSVLEGSKETYLNSDL
jgi:ATP-binding cassette, subfamily C (CFTR/MRP), member 1